MIVWPLRMLVNQPIQWGYNLSRSFQVQEKLLEKNAALHADNLLLQSQVQRLLTLQQENKQLRHLLQSTETLSSKVEVASILAVSLSPSLQQVVLGSGQRQGIYEGQPVLDAYGVMGQVVDAGFLTSKVLLLTDPRSAVPVQDYRNHWRAIAVGTGDMDRLRLINLPLHADLQVGDLFVTSGYGLKYPVGYPVGVVTQIVRSADQRFLEATLLPSAHLDRTQRVLLVWPSQHRLQQHVREMVQRQLPRLETLRS